jgi:hypothetical protein
LLSLRWLRISAVNGAAIFLALPSFGLWPFSVKELLAIYITSKSTTLSGLLLFFLFLFFFVLFFVLFFFVVFVLFFFVVFVLFFFL